MAATTNFYICGNCGFVNTPHAFRRDAANDSCEQCGTPKSTAGTKGATDLPAADAIRAKAHA